MEIKEIFHDKPAYFSEGNINLKVEVLFAGENESKVTEVLWCKKISESIYQLCCIPFLLSKFSLGDILEVKKTGLKSRIIRVLRPSEHTTFRVWATDSRRSEFIDIQKRLSEIECYVEELSSHKVLAISIEADKADDIENVLKEIKQKSSDIDYNQTFPQDEIDYKIHYHPVWREKADSIINASVENEIERNIYESLWAKKLENNLYEICCIPYFVYDLALGDLVETDFDKRGGLLYKKVIKPSDNETLWFQFNNATRNDLNRVLEKVINFKCLYEGYNKRFLAVNIDSESQHKALLDSFLGEIEAGLIEYSSNKRNP